MAVVSLTGAMERAQLAVVPLGPKDVADAQALHALAFPIPWSEASFQREMALPYSRFVGIRQVVNDELLACVCFWLVADEVHLLNIVTRPDARRQGLGALLVQEVLRVGRTSGCTSVSLEVRPSNRAALLLYERFGFVEVGRRKRYYKDNQEDALVLQRSIASAD